MWPHRALRTGGPRLLNDTLADALSDLRPKWYPAVKYDKAKEFTPRETEEWNELQRGATSKSA